MAAATSKETEIKLTNVARASLEELLADYRDFLRVRGLQEWPREHAYVSRLRELLRPPQRMLYSAEQVYARRKVSWKRRTALPLPQM